MENGERARERAEGWVVGGRGSAHLSSAPGSFSSSEPWPQIFPLRSALIGRRAGNARRSHCRMPAPTWHNAALPLQLSRRKQISNVALNKPVGNAPWYSRAQDRDVIGGRRGRSTSSNNGDRDSAPSMHNRGTSLLTY